MKRVLSVCIALIICLSVAPVTTGEVHAAQEDLYTAVERQIRAYAKSIDQPDAMDTAATALAVHGMSMNGKKLHMDESNALTAVLLNSGVAQRVLIESSEAAIRAMQQLDLERMDYIRGHISWDGVKESFYFMRVYSSADQPRDAYEWSLTSSFSTGSIEKWNGYDESLTWMGGGVSQVMSFKRTKVTADTVTYQVDLEFKDRFDFAISGNDLFKDMISGVGALLFKEFDWSATVTFDLTVPYTCCHESQNYRFTYDAESKTMTSDSASGWNANNVTRHSYSSNDGTVSYYYELAETVRLLHDAPWVMEFDSRSPNSFGLSPLPGTNYYYPVLHKNGRAFLYVGDYEWMPVSQEIMDEYGLNNEIQQTRHYYGTSLSERFTYSWSKTYTFRLENALYADGSNMIYLTVWETDTGTVVLDRIPMDDYYYYESWTQERTLLDENNAWLSGQDLIINYIGYGESRFAAGYFELRVWENGVNGESVSYYQDTVIAPTCSAEGYTVHTCTKCGYSHKTDLAEKLPHNYVGQVVAPTCSAEGYTQYTCTMCGDTYRTDTTEKLPHSCGEYISNNDATCAHDGTKTGKCTVCGEKVTVTDEGTALPHTWTDATCEKAKTCKFCGAVEGEALGHDLKFYNAKAPTCENVGWDAYEKCQRCNRSTFARLPALGHDHVNGVCTRCGNRDGSIVPGEVTGDGKIDLSDAYRIILHLTGEMELTEQECLAADVNGDGTVDMLDICRILHIYQETAEIR